MDEYNLERSLLKNREKCLVEKELSDHYDCGLGDLIEELKERAERNAQGIKRVDDLMHERIFDISTIINLPDIEFVESLYRGLLLREPDDGKVVWIKALICGDLDRMDVIEKISNSEEGRLLDVSLTGIDKDIKHMSPKRLKLLINRIPYIRYILEWVKATILLPKRLFAIQKQLEQLNYRNVYNRGDIFELQFKVEKLECRADVGVREDVSGLYKRLDDIRQKVEENASYIMQNLAIERDVRERKKRNQILLNEFYVTYNEMLFQDTREEVQSRKQIYIDKLNEHFLSAEKAHVKAVDLGCGTCEWVELLQNSGYDAIGVDANGSVIEKVRENWPGLKIIKDEAIEFLKKQANASVQIITSFHMVEHIEPIQLIELLEECYRVLSTGGILIMETPNPLNILVATYYFNLDPTHKKIIPVELLEVYIKNSGLEVKERVMVYPLNFTDEYPYKQHDPMSDVIFRFNMEQAYAVIAGKNE